MMALTVCMMRKEEEPWSQCCCTANEKEGSWLNRWQGRGIACNMVVSGTKLPEQLAKPKRTNLQPCTNDYESHIVSKNNVK